MVRVPAYLDQLAGALTGGSLDKDDLKQVEVAVKRSRGQNRMIVARVDDYVRYDAELDERAKASAAGMLRKLRADERQISKIRALPAPNVDIARVALDVDLRTSPIKHEVGLSL